LSAAVIGAWTASGLDLWSTVANMGALQKLGVAVLTAAATLLIGIVSRWANGKDTVSVFPSLSVAKDRDTIKNAVNKLEREFHELHPGADLQATQVESMAKTMSEIDQRGCHPVC
jgi:hypothetical protein